MCLFEILEPYITTTMYISLVEGLQYVSGLLHDLQVVKGKSKVTQAIHGKPQGHSNICLYQSCQIQPLDLLAV